MDNNINFKDLWVKQPTTLPNLTELMAKVKQIQKSNFRKVILTNLLLIVTTAFIIFIWAYYQPQLWTTKIGIILVILAMVIFIVFQNQLLPLLKSIDESQNNVDYLKNLQALKTKQQFIQSTLLNFYFILLSIGISLYLYEYTAKMTPFWAISAYALTLAWIALNWFYIRPKTIQKQQLKLNGIIDTFEKINQEMEEK
ncbi:hypothetical protein [Flavobacterium sp. '19STA2R22 D10 B1']|uniref:hypothetical protein n=1 Tax=Flavobacterium aerium TaxID=3037261 RepID=UPI00278C361C|nr:hypothetical protein [Flavobacterium sp. '19STA2R22 D10 B1']